MSNRIFIKKASKRSKKLRAAMRKERNKTIQQLQKEALQRSIMYEREMVETARQTTRQSSYETVITTINNQPDEESSVKENNDMDIMPTYRRTIISKSWERYTTQKLVNMYISSLANGKPSLALTDPQQQTNVCGCTDKRTKNVTLYMMCAHVDRIISYCTCKPLVEALFEMQFLASSGKAPNAAIHFALLKYLHDTKMTEQTSTHGFADIANLTNENGKKLKKDVLNNVYFLYRRIANHSTDHKLSF